MGPLGGGASVRNALSFPVLWAGVQTQGMLCLSPSSGRGCKRKECFVFPPLPALRSLGEAWVLYQNLSLASTTHRKMYRTRLISPASLIYPHKSELEELLFVLNLEIPYIKGQTNIIYVRITSPTNHNRLCFSGL